MEEKTIWIQVAIPMTKKEIEALNKVKKETGVSKGFFLRRAINEKIARDFQ